MFMLFGSQDCYYASGGWHDFLGTYAALDEAKDAARKWRIRQEWMDDEDFAAVRPIEWWHVVDASSGRIVAGSKVQAHGAPVLKTEEAK